MNFNRVILACYLTRDPEVHYTPNGTAIAKFGLAINRTWKTETGETNKEVTFVDIDAFGRPADVISEYLKKGRPILVEGRLKLNQWDDKQTGQKRSRLGVVLEIFQFLDFGRDSEAAPRETQAPKETAPQRRFGGFLEDKTTEIRLMLMEDSRKICAESPGQRGLWSIQRAASWFCILPHQGTAP